MTITESEYLSVADRAAELGCPMPTGFAVMPQNFDTATSRNKLLFRSEAATIRKLFRLSATPFENFLPGDERVPSIHNKSFDWAPLLFVSAALMSSDPNAISVALGVISNYLTDFFRGIHNPKVKLNVVVERKKDRTCKKLSYEGDVAGLLSLVDAIRKINDE